ncbi:hypothetical protein E1B28_003665 [Marasmius oreades]|uniref:Uncharacterized protein n=1 Tax=Marasmius oreades TaxID=181124 RepID=A0A9P7UX49_9AGAR|nr:uncharacterized protein E1B28_003665 [Marasmius oreades]KAG7096213.1 hypothetical protein E1B28_003665 [Marasmius oreades]
MVGVIKSSKGPQSLLFTLQFLTESRSNLYVRRNRLELGMQYLFVITATFLPFLLAAVQAQEECGPERIYVNAESNAQHCCSPGQDLVIYDQKSRVGVCCGVDQDYAGIAPNGKCCPQGQILGADGKCTNPPGGNCPSCPNQPVGACRRQRACGDVKTNGLKYGSCYEMTFPNSGGKQMGRDWPSDTYIPDGHVQNIIYKICQSTDGACGTGPVKPTDTFVIEDKVGNEGDTTDVQSWIGNGAVNGASLALTTIATKAAQFQGTTSCSKCTCVVALTGVGRGLSTRDGDPVHIAFSPNPRVTLDMEFTELPCDDLDFPED